MSRTLFIPEEALARARSLRAGGSSWNNIERQTGFDRNVIRCRIDPEFAKRNRANPDALGKFFRPSEVVVRRMDAPPADTRSYTARAMGDPLPGRSALDRKAHAAGVVVKTHASPLKKKMVIDDVFRTIEMEDRHSNFEAVD